MIPEISSGGRGGLGVSVFSMLLSSSLDVSAARLLFFGRSLKKTTIAQMTTKGMCTRNDLDREQVINIHEAPSSINVFDSPSPSNRSGENRS